MTKARVAFTVLALAIIISACDSGATPSPTRISTPIPTATPTAAPAPTNTSRLVKGSYFVPYQSNPVLTQGAPGSWDAEAIFSSYVTFHDGLYHMYYNGISSPDLETMAIGYATSVDGQSFTRHAANPILTGDESGFDARRVGYGVPLLEGDAWTLYYNAGSGTSPGKTIGRATSSDPAGPWRRAMHYVLAVGSPGEWDSKFIIPESVIATDEGYVMYYSGEYTYYDENGLASGAAMIGMATSPDGIVWTKYNDPSTTGPPFAESDPVLQPGPDGSWDVVGVWECAVRKTTSAWEMFYTGSDLQSVQIGYATSADGIHWIKHDDNPIIVPEIDPLATKTEPFILEAPSIIVNDSTYTLYYDYGLATSGIGIAVGEIPR